MMTESTVLKEKLPIPISTSKVCILSNDHCLLIIDSYIREANHSMSPIAHQQIPPTKQKP